MIATVAVCLILFLKVHYFIRATKTFKYLKECIGFIIVFLNKDSQWGLM